MSELAVKGAVRARDGFRCVGCSMTNDEHRRRYGRELDVHRKTPGGLYAIDDCETLCRFCHGSKPKSNVGVTLNQHVHPHIGLTLSPETLELVDADALLNGHSRAAQIRLIIKEYYRSRGVLPPVPPMPSAERRSRQPA